jgi:hypothetical protein
MKVPLRLLALFAAVVLAGGLLSSCGGGSAMAATPPAGTSDSTPASTLLASADYVQMDAAGEPYLMRCAAGATRIVLFLHTWSGDLTQVRSMYPDGVPGACVISPNFNGPNTTLKALASEEALGRIALAVVDTKMHTALSRVHMVAASGGTLAGLGYIGRYGGVERASLWLVIHDLERLYWTTTEAQVKGDLQAVLGVPALNDPVYLARSPKSRLTEAMPRPRVILNVGTVDTVTPAEQGAAARDQMLARGFDVAYNTWAIAHVFGPDQTAEALRQLAD